MYAFNLDGKRTEAMANTDGSPGMKQNNISVQSKNGLVLYKDSFDLEVQTFRMNLLQFIETKKDQVRNITADIVNTLMRSLAVETYKLTKKEDIQLFSYNTLRVSAYTLLFSTI